MTFQRLVRFIPKANQLRALIGEPVNAELDVGKATYEGKDVEVKVYSGSSVLNPGQATDQVESIGKLLSPLSVEEVGTIRCIGLNVREFGTPKIRYG